MTSFHFTKSGIIIYQFIHERYFLNEILNNVLLRCLVNKWNSWPFKEYIRKWYVTFCYLTSSGIICFPIFIRQLFNEIFVVFRDILNSILIYGMACNNIWPFELLSISSMLSIIWNVLKYRNVKSRKDLDKDYYVYKIHVDVKTLLFFLKLWRGRKLERLFN